MLCAGAVDKESRSLRTDPSRVPGKFCIDTDRHLKMDVWKTSCHVFQEKPVQRNTLALADTGRYADAGSPELAHSSAGNDRVGIGHANDDATYAGAPDQIGARWCLTKMCTGLEVDVQNGIPGDPGDSCKTSSFGMGAAEKRVEALPEDLPAGEEDCTDRRIGTDPANSFTGQLQASPHPTLVFLLSLHGHRFSLNENTLPSPTVLLT